MDVAVQTSNEGNQKPQSSKLKITVTVIDFKALWQEWKSQPNNPEAFEITNCKSKSTQTKQPCNQTSLPISGSHEQA